MDIPEFSVSQFVGVCNQVLSGAFSPVKIVGEVSGYKESQGKWVFFDLKDEESSVGCFIPIWQMRHKIEDGMKVRVMGTAKLTNWGKFSVTVSKLEPVGKGNIKKSFDLLREKLEKEGLFDIEKKRDLPWPIQKIGVISSTEAAGYADFVKIADERWGGLEIKVCHTQVQGMVAADQIIRALRYLNERAEVDVITIIRGGGSADDLSVFNDEKLVRAVAASRIPVVTGIGHEIDGSLCDMAADVVASTPSNAAQILTPDRNAVYEKMMGHVNRAMDKMNVYITFIQTDMKSNVKGCGEKIRKTIEWTLTDIEGKRKILESFNPGKMLSKGYAIVHGKAKVGAEIEVETDKEMILTEVKRIHKKKAG